MATYYVDATDGDDSAAGTSTGTAWQTIGKVNGESFSNGDQVLFQRGETFNDATLTCDNAGVTYGAYGTGDKPLFNRNNWNIIIVSADSVTLDNLEVSSGTGFGIEVQAGGTNVTISDCDVHDCHHEGIRLGSATATISGGSVYGNGTGNAVGIRVNTAMTTLLVEDTDIYCDTDQETGILFYDANGASGITLRNITVRGHTHHGIDMFVDGDGTMSDITIEGCAIYGNGTAVQGTYRGAGLGASRCSSMVIQKCTIKENCGWGIDCYLCDVDVFNNLIYDNRDNVGAQGPGIGIEINSCDDARVYNNTVYSNETGIFSSALSSGGTYNPSTITHNVRNNIEYDNSDNDWDEDYTDEPGGCSRTITHSDYLQTDPSFVDADSEDFKLQVGSDAIDAGADLSGTVDDDYDGNPRPLGADYDIGAHESLTLTPRIIGGGFFGGRCLG